YLGPYFPAKLNSCTLCHLPDQPGVEGKPHNAFGKRLKELGIELQKAGKPWDIPRRFEMIADEDSDGDGVPNLIEILTGHNPGDPNDKPSPEEISAARKTLVECRKYLSAYPWRPFEPVTRPAIPTVRNPSWCRNPIDFFIAAEHEVHGLKPRPEANKAALLRRVYFDLIGLPPTPEELHAFLNDNSSDAYEKVVDKLLASPQYGERWGRHWMDIWRYSDWAGWTGGNQIRDSQPHIWRWRDWIIEALNSDKGYNQMILEMLAADELYPEDENALRATGYLVRNYKMLSREKWLEDTVDHTFLAFQGVTIGCARCHDHMFDPILQKEYYEVRAIFTPHNVRIDRVPGQPDTKLDGLARVYDAEPAAQTFLLIRGDDRNPDKTPLPPGVPAALGGKYSPSAVDLPLTAYIPERRPFVLEDQIRVLEEKLTDRDKQVIVAQRARWWPCLAVNPTGGPLSTVSLLVAQPQLDAVAKAALMEREAEVEFIHRQRLLAVVERLENAGKAETPEWKKAAEQLVASERWFDYLTARNKLFQLETTRTSTARGKNIDEQLADVRKMLASAESDLHAPPSVSHWKRMLTSYSATSTGRRTAFACWLADKNNPLTARVAINHIWLRHFGQAIVPSVFDFGRNGRPPSHPALLDWLAAELMNPAACGLALGDSQASAKPQAAAGAWSMKHLHRLIVTSATYRQSSTSDPASAAIDRDNKYLWHMPPRRLEAEIVRDEILYVAGKLDQSFSGPEIDQNLGMTNFRRSLYFRHAAEKEMEFLKLFDAASVTECYQRKESIIPQQALALSNSELTIRMARLLARELAAKHSDVRVFVTAAFERTLSRPPTTDEMRECLDFLEQQQKAHAGSPAKPQAADGSGHTPAADSALRARENLVQVLFNHHEFVTVR
ncbi:MAG TPA: DUF1549 and DUF1553 domain-containing protein, partial [Gemmataceae bacterium]|nr:DUF1549 and DUF1553 domain-containing protein [Gemmataceae bacterium]